MVTLHWHRWRAPRGKHLSYYLSTEPWNGDETVRLLTGEIAAVTYTPGSKQWGYQINPIGRSPYAWGLIRTAAQGRKAVEAHFNRRCGAAFDVDAVTYVPAT